MPYTKDCLKTAEELKQRSPKDVGELNLYFTLEIITRFLAVPRYATIHALFKEAFLEERPNPFARWPKVDVDAARRLAYIEFNRRIVGRYEDGKAEENGDIYAQLERTLWGVKS